jgi:chemotaxis protein MotB
VFALTRRGRYAVNVWPAFVDALASVLLVFIFMLLVFVLGQAALGELLAGRDRALDELRQHVSELARTLSLERAQGEDLSARLAATLAERDRLAAQAESAAAEAAQLRAGQEEAAAAADARVATLNDQLAALRRQLAEIAAALELEQAAVARKEAEIARLGERLNVALARKVDELQRYRSEFFGRLREALGDHPSVRIVGDRFVFQSELLFPTASATLVPEGRRQLARLADTLKAVTAKIPSDVEWVLRIDGHTDRRPIRTDRYASNWELSTARALSVVRFLESEGIPPARLAAAGFGEYHPLQRGDLESAYARNRRIEIKLTQP